MRKTATITITDEGRDKGKVFLLREMPASRAEMWGIRAFMAISKSGIDIPDNVANLGLAGIASLGLKALQGVNFDDAKPLLDELMTCVSIIPDPSTPQVIRALIEDDIEEIGTRLKLRSEVFKLHVDFSKLVAPSKSASGTAGENI